MPIEDEGTYAFLVDGKELAITSVNNGLILQYYIFSVYISTGITDY